MSYFDLSALAEHEKGSFNKYNNNLKNDNGDIIVLFIMLLSLFSLLVLSVYEQLKDAYKSYRDYGVYFSNIEERIRKIRLYRQLMGINIDEITAEDLANLDQDRTRHACDVCQSFNINIGHARCVNIRQLDLDILELPIELPHSPRERSEADRIARYLKERFGNTQIEITRKLNSDFSVQYNLIVQEKDFVPVKYAGKQ